MWILKWISAALIIILVLGFTLQNNSQEVSIIFLKGKYETGPIPVWVIVYLSFALGVIFWLFFSIFQVLSLKMQIRKLRADNQKIQRELDNLRNLSIEAEVETAPAPQLPEAQEKPQSEPGAEGRGD